MSTFRRLAAICAIALLSKLAIAQESVVKQEPIGPMACGPCAVVNSLTIAKSPALTKLPGETQLEKVRSFIEQFSSEDSLIYGKHRKVYSEKLGAADRDLRFMLSKFFEANGLGEVKGQYAVRDKDSSESKAAFVARAHRLLLESIETGFHPIVSVRAIAAEFNKQRDRHLWNSKGGHFVAVHEVGDLRDGSLSFPVVISDSGSGRLLTAYVYLDPARKSSVPMQFTADQDGKEVWSWERGENTLAILCPEMPLGTRNVMWYERTVIAVRYLITR